MVNEAEKILLSIQTDTDFDPIAEAQKLIDGVDFDRNLATSYGRKLFEKSFEAQTVTEIKAQTHGAQAFFPEPRTVLDIGGQEIKAIALFENGTVKKFEMNDHCTAGTGKFLEIMAQRVAVYKTTQTNRIDSRSLFRQV